MKIGFLDRATFMMNLSDKMMSRVPLFLYRISKFNTIACFCHIFFNVHYVVLGRDEFHSSR